MLAQRARDQHRIAHARLPPIDEQLPLLRALWPGPLVCRWSLNRQHGAQGYEEARERYRPFNALVDPDPGLCATLARVIAGTTGAGFPAYVTVNNKAVLVLDDRRVFVGTSFGVVGQTLGEAVFSTGMSGYQETLTDPSYHRQVVVATAPHIGNTGWNDEDDESQQIWVAGYVVRDPARIASNWRSQPSMPLRFWLMSLNGSLCRLSMTTTA